MRSAARRSVRVFVAVALTSAITVAATMAPVLSPTAVAGGGQGLPKCQKGFLERTQPTATDCLATSSTAGAATVAQGFQQATIWSGLTNPTVLRFAADGRVFVAEKAGVIKVFDSLSDPTPTSFTGLTTNVQNFWDRGLLGLALDPSLTGGVGNGSYVYVMYTYDHILGTTGTAPRWGDTCPTPPGATTDGCVVSTRLSRFSVTGTTISGPEHVLMEDWCQQFPSHSAGTLAFGPDGALYVSAGDGASFNVTDYGQLGGTTDPVVTGMNPCGDPPGGAMAPPAAEGGALRSLDLLTHPDGSAGDPVSPDGAILRIDPATGAGKAGNPFASSADPNARRIIAYGLRNPFRMAFRPGTSELWVGDVGWNLREEINRIGNATDNVAEDFGWPCYEGAGRTAAFDTPNFTICENLYTAGTAAGPYYSYSHNAQVVATDSCAPGGSSITGIAFYPTAGGSYPADYAGGVFFADHTRNCIWFMPRGSNGLPDASQVRVFVEAAGGPVDLEIGPGNDLFYVDFDDGTIRRVLDIGNNQPPTAVITAAPTSGPPPLTVSLDASLSSDPERTDLTYAWDLDNDGAFDDGTGVTATATYTALGNATVRLRVTDAALATDVATKVISVGNTPPTPVISTPSSTTTWKVGDVISFSGSASDTQDGALPPSALTWTLVLQHCPSNCHSHTIQTFDGVASGSFNAPDHDYPSYLELTLTATDSNGASASVTRRLDPRTVVLTFQTTPSGLPLTVDSASSKATFQRTVIVGSTNSVSAATPVSVGLTTYSFVSWSDGGAATHTIVAPATNTTLTAAYRITTISFLPTADANTRAAQPTTNFGASSVLRVRLAKSRVYLKFSVTGLARAPSSAKLRLWVTNSSAKGGSIYKLTSTGWTETGITWSNAPAISGTALSSLGTTTAGRYVFFNLGSAITGNGTYAFGISQGSDDAAEYASRETTTRPVLQIKP